MIPSNKQNIKIISIVTEAEIPQNTNYEVPEYVLGNNSINLF